MGQVVPREMLIPMTAKTTAAAEGHCCFDAVDGGGGDENDDSVAAAVVDDVVELPEVWCSFAARPWLPNATPR